jgi:hypothetical protein
MNWMLLMFVIEAMMFDGCNELLMMTEDDNLFLALCWYWQL